MFDLHAHILPIVDDGAEDFEMTLDMLRIAENDGVTHIVATPHYICGANRYTRKFLLEIYGKVNDLIEDNGINITLLPGNELFLDEFALEHLKSGKCFPLVQSRYVLVEFPLAGIPRNAESLIYGFLSAGYVPVIAHAERYPDVDGKMDLLYDLVNLGCLIQVNSTSITGYCGKKVMKTAMELVSANMASIVASDCHSNRYRSPGLSRAYGIISKHFGVKKAELLFKTNPSRIIEDREVLLDGELRLKRKKYLHIFGLQL